MRIKIKERKDSRFSIGGSAVILFMIGAPFAYLVRNGDWLSWLEGHLNQIGFGRFSYYGAVAFTFIAAFAFYLPATKLATRRKTKLQPSSDAEANSSKTTALYLRPFFTDTKTQLLSPFYSNLSMGISLEPPFLGPEEFVGRVLEPYIDVCQVRGDAETIRAGIIPVAEEESWEMAIVKAIWAASVTVILPSFSRDQNEEQNLGTGTIWELKYLVKSERISRTIVIMPRVHWMKRRAARKLWEQARQEVSTFGLVLPEYRNTGGSIVFEHAHGVWQPKMVFGQRRFGRKRFAAGLVEALQWQAKRHGFALLDR